MSGVRRGESSKRRRSDDAPGRRYMSVQASPTLICGCVGFHKAVRWEDDEGKSAETATLLSKDLELAKKSLPTARMEE